MTSKNDLLLPLYEDPSIRERFGAAAHKMQQQFWDNQAPGWNAQLENQGLQPRHIEKMAAWLTDPVLLVGVGRGMILKALQAKGYAATGVDWSANMVAHAQREGIRGLRHGDAARLEFGSQSLATVVISTGVMLPTHTQDRMNAYLGEAWRVLVPAGHLILCLLFKQGSIKARHAAENVQLPIHTLQAQMHWDLGRLTESLSRLPFQTTGQVKDGDVLIWSLVKTASQF